MAGDIAIGIDLGTTFSCVAVFQNGKVEIIPNSQGHRTTPSFVLFTDSERLIGDAAFNQVTRSPFNRVFDAKRLIGRKFNDECVQKDMKHWPFHVINSNGNPKIRLDFMGETKDFHPEEISSMVLVEMKETAESYLGKKVENAVITVPAYFNDSQRQATKDAGAIAGLNVMKIINEPTAAAIAYGYDKTVDLNILIFDFGGGTFDVSVLHIKNKEIVVKSTGGDTHLGGEDINNILVDHFVEEIKRKHKKDITDNKRSIGILRREVERAKKELSHCTFTAIEIDCLIEDISFDSSITRGKFNELCKDLFQSTIIRLEKALNDAKMEKKDISEVILVGGSSRIPKVQELVQQFFNGKKLNNSINQDEAVAYGAAIQAAVMNGDQNDILRGLTLHDVTPLSLGIITMFDRSFVVVPRNSPIPLSINQDKWSTNEDNQTGLLFQVFEGERTMKEDNNILGKLSITGITPLPKGKALFSTEFKIDSNGILSVSVLDKTLGTVSNIQVDNEKGRLSPQQINKMIEDAAKYKSQDEKLKECRKVFARLQDYCYDMNNMMMDPKNEEIPFVYRTLVINACNEVTKWIERNKKATKEVIEKKEKDLKIICQPTLNLIKIE